VSTPTKERSRAEYQCSQRDINLHATSNVRNCVARHTNIHCDATHLLAKSVFVAVNAKIPVLDEYREDLSWSLFDSTLLAYPRKITVILDEANPDAKMLARKNKLVRTLHQ
jgi:hypothetical protein